jgi:tetrahydromethanopterin S-methyltransferase subunit B
MQTLIPDIEDNIPLPKNATEAMPNLSPKEELDMRARTIKVLADLAGTSIQPAQEHIEEAETLAREMISNPKMRPEYNRYPNETMAYLAGMVAQTNCMLVDELSELKMYVVNRLIMEIEEAKDSRSRIAALSKLGEVDGVDAFKKRTEVTVQIKPIEEVEKELLTILEGIEYTVEDAVIEEAPK